MRVAEAFTASTPEVELLHPRAFVYVSAEDIFRPFISARYIETKRQAELDIGNMMASNPAYRPVYVRPSAYFQLPFISLGNIETMCTLQQA